MRSVRREVEVDFGREYEEGEDRGDWMFRLDLGTGKPTTEGSGRRKRKSMQPTAAVRMPGRMKAMPQLLLAKAQATRAPRMLPRLDISGAYANVKIPGT